MRVRNNPLAKEILKNSKNVIDEVKIPSEYEIVNLEIGCGKGDYALSMAQKNPHQYWIAIEKNPSILAIAIKKADQLNLNNLRFMNCDATYLKDFFESCSVHNIYLNFSDPWPKNRTAKRRLSSQQFCDLYQFILKPEGHIYMKTDNYDLFVYSLNMFIKKEFILEFVDTHFDSEKYQDAISEYEQKFRSRNIAINRLIVKRGD